MPPGTLSDLPVEVKVKSLVNHIWYLTLTGRGFLSLNSNKGSLVTFLPVGVKAGNFVNSIKYLTLTGHGFLSLMCNISPLVSLSPVGVKVANFVNNIEYLTLKGHGFLSLMCYISPLVSLLPVGLKIAVKSAKLRKPPTLIFFWNQWKWKTNKRRTTFEFMTLKIFYSKTNPCCLCSTFVKSV